MAQERHPKRARKKERRDQRREEWMRYVQRRRRQRWGVLLGSLLVVAAGVGITFLVFMGGEEQPSASPTPAASGANILAPKKTPVACDADVPKTAGGVRKQYGKAKDQDLDPDKTYIWHLETSCGDVDIELDVERAPKTSNSIAYLAREGFYDGLFFHRINESFVIQGGDPVGDGTGGAGYQVIEPPPDDLKYEKGVVAMAKGGPDAPGTSGSQFFIVTGDEGEVLPPEYALAGKVVEGMDVVEKIESFASTEDGPPTDWTYIERSTIEEQ